MVQQGTIWYNMAQYGTIWHNMVQYVTIWYNMAQYGTIWLNMVQSCKASIAKGTTEPVARCQQTLVLSTLLRLTHMTTSATIVQTISLVGLVWQRATSWLTDLLSNRQGKTMIGAWFDKTWGKQWNLSTLGLQLCEIIRLLDTMFETKSYTVLPDQ